MAWITKKSSAPIADPRDTPYLSQEVKDHFEREIIPRYPTRQASTIALLHAIQEDHSWLPVQAMEEAAEFLGIAPSAVMDTATFYEEFFLEPRGKYTVWVCQSISCEIMGNIPLMEKLSDLLGIAPGETTEDGKFTLMDVECIGACGGAPCALVNEKLHENLTPDNAEKILANLD